MPRVKGQRREDYHEKRNGLLERLSGRLRHVSNRASFRDLASSALVSVPTLRHYFGDRDGLIRAYFEFRYHRALHHRERGSTPGGPLEQSLRQLLEDVWTGLTQRDLARLQMLGFSEGMYNSKLGPAYLEFVLEPFLASLEQRLSAHLALGELRECSLRYATLALISPLLIAAFHQNEFGGAGVRKIDIDEFIQEHVAAFVRAYGSENNLCN